MARRAGGLLLEAKGARGERALERGPLARRGDAGGLARLLLDDDCGGLPRGVAPGRQHDRFPALTGHFGPRGPLAATKPTFCRTAADDRS